MIFFRGDSPSNLHKVEHELPGLQEQLWEKYVRSEEIIKNRLISSIVKPKIVPEIEAYFQRNEGCWSPHSEGDQSSRTKCSGHGREIGSLHRA